jgi:hypothetical protein
LFLLVGFKAARAGHWPHTPELFALSRIAAESRLRANLHPCEVSLRGIYDQLAFTYALGQHAVVACLEIEISVEGALLRVVPAARHLLEEARRAGSQVGFISDIYLPVDVVRKWLVLHGVLVGNDALWVSSESGLTKASGKLFERALNDAATPRNWLHIGDHPRSDVAIPRSLGIQAELSTTCRLTRYEEIMEEHAHATGGLSSLLAGASRWVRLSHSAVDDAQVSMRGIAAGVAGPTLWAFVTWVLRTAERDGLRQIWFTARDGQIMLRMAKNIAARLGINIQMGYLYAGRQVVHLAGLHQIDERALKWLTGGAGVVTATALLERVGLAPDDLLDALERHGIPLTGQIGWSRMSALEGFFGDPSVQTAVLAAANKRRADIRSYFEACGLLGNEPCAIVDIGWRGSVLRSIFDILGPLRAAQHQFLYFGLYGRPIDVPEAKMSAFCFDTSQGSVLGVGSDVPSLTSVMEIFCQADHQQVIHVRKELDTYVPILRASSSPERTSWEVSYFQSCLVSFADNMIADIACDLDRDVRSMCVELLQALMSSPEPSEAYVLGSVQFFDDQGGTTSQPFAKPFSLIDSRALLRTGKLPQKSLAWWEEGSWALTPKIIKLWLRGVRKMGLARLKYSRVRGNS